MKEHRKEGVFVLGKKVEAINRWVRKVGEVIGFVGVSIGLALLGWDRDDID